MIQTQQQGPWGGGGGGYGGPPGGGGYGGPPGGGGYGGPPGGPPGGGGYGGPPGGPPGGGGYGGPPGGPPGGGGYGGPPGGYGGPPGGGFGGPPMMQQYPGQQFPTGAKSDVLAVVSLIAGLISLPTMFCCSFFGIPLSLTAIICGIISISNINKKPNELTGKGLAIIGIATGGVGLVLLVVLIAVGVAGQILNRIF